MPSHLNTSVIANAPFLRTAGAAVVHLVERARDGQTGQPAVDTGLLADLGASDPEALAAFAVYPAEDLALPVWSSRTLCGQEWSVMATAEDERVLRAGSEPRPTSRYAPPVPRFSQLACFRCTGRFLLP